MSVAMMEEGPRHRVTVGEYYRMAEVGLLAPDAWVELIEGEIIDMPTIGSPHAAVVSRLDRLLAGAIGERAIIRCQLPIRLDEFSEPQPDLTVAAYRDDYYIQSHPTGADVLLAVEVGDTSVRYDLGKKMSLYASHGVREYWVADVRRAQVHIFRMPTATAYQEAVCVERPTTVSISELPGVTVDLSSLPWTHSTSSGR